MKLITLSATMWLVSCAHMPRLAQSGIYTVKARVGNLTTFLNIKGKYWLECKPIDTLKVGDSIQINIVYPSKK